MGSHIKIVFIALLVLLVVISACDARSGSAGNPAEGMRVATLSSSAGVGANGPTLVPTNPPPDHGPFILMVDDFSDPSSGWEVSQGDYGRTAYEEGEYLVEAYIKQEFYWGVAGIQVQDVRIDVDVRVMQTNEIGNDAYGPDCRVQPNGDGYGFRISSDGYAGIQKYVDGESSNLVEWTSSDAIHTDGSSNSITAVCQGDHLQLLVNGENVLEAVDNVFSTGDVSLSAIGYESGTVSVLFDNLTIQQVGTPYLYDDGSLVDITIHNASGMDVCFVYVTSPANPTWGSNLVMDMDGIFKAGEVRTFGSVAEGVVDILILACDYLRLAEIYEYDPALNPRLDIDAPILLKEFRFTQPDDWTILSTDNGSTAISNADYYAIVANGEPGVMLGMVWDEVEDIIIHTEVMLVKPGKDNLGYSGPVCRADLNGYGVLFAVRADGQAAILKLKGGTVAVLQDWAPSEDIRTGFDYNLIEAHCEGTTYSMYVNGGFIGSVVDTSYTRGGIGVAASSPLGSLTQADYDFLRLYQP